jgi:hypothetical protein
MYHVELKYSRRNRGGRYRKVKKVGAHSVCTLTYSPAVWNKAESKHRWLKMMIWNRAALHYEGGALEMRGTWAIAYKRFREQNRCVFQRREKC